MGCQVLAMLDADTATGTAILAQVPNWFATWEQLLSRFRADSELSLLNRTGYLSPTSPELWDVVQLALAHARQTKGLVTPTLLDALEAAGYDRSFEALQPQHSVPQVVTMAENAWQAIHCDPLTRSIRLPGGVRLDLGGSAKGWAVDQAVRRLASFGPALVDAGGDIAVTGPQADGSAWPIGVADPYRPEAQCDILLLTKGGVATSGIDYRRWQRGAHWQHHLIDPRTFTPADTDVLSATVVGPAVTDCEAAAKTVLLLGSQSGIAWLEARPTLAGIVVFNEGTIQRSGRWAAYCWPST